MKKNVFVLGLLASASVAFGQINYGNLTGTNFVYRQVVESSGTDTPPLFGAPTLLGDALTFNPSNFGSTASGANGVDITDGQLSMFIDSIAGAPITQVAFTERGDYRFVGVTGTTATSATVSLTVFIRILAINGAAPVGGPIALPVMIGSFSPSGGTFDFVNDPTPSGNVPWAGGGTVDIAAFMAANNIAGNATSVSVALDNTLTTTSEAGTISFIRKKEFGGLTITVPTPGAAALFGMGMLAAGRRRR